MADSTTTAASTDAGITVTEPAQAPENGGGENQPAGGSRTFTQDEVNSLMARERRDTQAKFADYDELKAKAARLDAIEEANKSEIEKANDAAAKAAEEAKGWQSKYEELKAEAERREAIDKAAAQYNVDAAMLARMSGDVEDNARFLAEQDASRPKYPNVSDEGEGKAGSLTGVTEEDIASEKDPVKRVRMRAELIAQSRKA